MAVKIPCVAQMSELNQQLTDCSLIFYMGVSTPRVISWGNANIFKHIPDSSWTEPEGTKSPPQINFTQRFFSSLLTGSYSTDLLSPFVFSEQFGVIYSFNSTKQGETSCLADKRRSQLDRWCYEPPGFPWLARL